MKLKPRTTVGNEKALIYKRYISIEQSMSTKAVYKIVYPIAMQSTNEPTYWVVDNEQIIGRESVSYLDFYPFEGNLQIFKQLDSSLVNQFTNIIEITPQDNLGSTNYTILQYKGAYFYFSNDGEWKALQSIVSIPQPIISMAKSGNIAKYQLNKYYYVGSFDYMISGEIDGTTTQYIKGNIMPFSSVNIKFFDDEIQLHPDDLVVLMDRLWTVENPQTVQKRMPKPYKVHFATLNSIL